MKKYIISLLMLSLWAESASQKEYTVSSVTSPAKRLRTRYTIKYKAQKYKSKQVGPLISTE